MREDWFGQLAAREDTLAIAQGVAAAVTNLFLDSDARTRNAIETGFLEHVLEQHSLRSLFAHWQHDERLHDAWRLATAWGDAHPNLMNGLRAQLRTRSTEDD